LQKKNVCNICWADTFTEIGVLSLNINKESGDPKEGQLVKDVKKIDYLEERRVAHYL